MCSTRTRCPVWQRGHEPFASPALSSLPQAREEADRASCVSLSGLPWKKLSWTQVTKISKSPKEKVPKQIVINWVPTQILPSLRRTPYQQKKCLVSASTYCQEWRNRHASCRSGTWRRRGSFRRYLDDRQCLTCIAKLAKQRARLSRVNRNFTLSEGDLKCNYGVSKRSQKWIIDGELLNINKSKGWFVVGDFFIYSFHTKIPMQGTWNRSVRKNVGEKSPLTHWRGLNFRQS